MKRFTSKIDFDLDVGFWHLVPSININLHSHELEFEWLCIGIYISKVNNMKTKLNDNEVREIADMQSNLNAYECFITALWMLSSGKENITYPWFTRTPCDDIMVKLWKWVKEKRKEDK